MNRSYDGTKDLQLHSTVHGEISRPAGETRDFGRTPCLLRKIVTKPLPGIEIKNSSSLLSIFSARDDYRMNDPAREAVVLGPPKGEEQ
jgi:hypothetical protein